MIFKVLFAFTNRVKKKGEIMKTKRVGQVFFMVVGLASFCLALYAFALGAFAFTVYEVFMTFLFSMVVVENYLKVHDECGRGGDTFDSETVNF